MAKIRLKKCPFCGERTEIYNDKYQSGYWKVSCLACRATGPESFDRKLAIDEWNNRED